MWSVICFTLPNYLQIIFHSLHITHLLAKGNRESLPMAPLQPHASSHRTLVVVVVVAHHCSTMTHPRTDRTTHKQTDRTIVLAHPLTTTTVTRSDHLYLDGTFRSRCRCYHRCLSLSLKFIVIACLFLKSHSRCLNPLSISLSLSLSLDLVFGIWN